MEILRRRRIKQLVRELYRGFLGREPDPEGARHYETLLLKRGPENALPSVLARFRRSREYANRAGKIAVSHVNATLASQSCQLINGHPVNHLVSLGSFCLPSIICKTNGLRRYSLPFDWIFSTPRMVRDCVADDFAVFLDRRHYRPNKGSQGGDPTAEHELYRERYGISSLFAHHDPTRETDYLHFARSVNRFRQLLNNDESKLFLIAGRPHHDLPNEFPLLIELLERSTKNFALLGVEILDPVEPGVSMMAPVAKVGHHTLHRFTPSSFDGIGARFPDKLDEWTVLRLIYRFKLALKGSPWDGDESPQVPGAFTEEASGPEEPEHASDVTLS